MKFEIVLLVLMTLYRDCKAMHTVVLRWLDEQYKIFYLYEDKYCEGDHVIQVAREKCSLIKHLYNNYEWYLSST